MAADVLRITDGESHCRIPDSASGTISAPLLEIGLQGALVDTKVQLEANAYIDVTLALKDLAPRQLFAHVVTSGDKGLSLRWLHFDPGEEAKLKNLLEGYARARAGSQAPNAQSGTRRVIRPKGDAQPATSDLPSSAPSMTRRLVRPTASAITPFSDAPVTPSTLSSASSAFDSASGARVGTRRVVRPSQQALTPFADVTSVPTPAIGEDSRMHQVVIEPTERFDKLIDVGEEKAHSGAPVVKSTRPSSAVESLLNTPAIGNLAIPVGTIGAASAAETKPIRDVRDVRDESGAQSLSSGRSAVLGKDGRMDIGASIRIHAKTIRASELASRHERVRVLNMATIKSLITEAVEEAASYLTRSRGEAEPKRLLEEAEEGFQERLKSFQAEKQSADERAKRLNEQLESARNLLAEERKRSIKADQFTVSAEGLGEIEERFQRFLDRTLAAGKVPPDVEEDLRQVIGRVLDSERERIRAKELEAQNAKIQLLERKINRLAGSLEESEKQRDEAQRFSAFLESQGGGALRNVYEAGIKSEDPNKEKKLSLMKKILDENRALRQSLGIQLSEVKDEPKAEAKGELKKDLTPDASAASAAPVVSAAPVASVPAADVGPDSEDEPNINQSTDAEGVENGAEPEVNPDDEVWEVKPLANTSEGINQSGIKRIDVTNVLSKGPPPLERR